MRVDVGPGEPGQTGPVDNKLDKVADKEQKAGPQVAWGGDKELWYKV